MELDGTASPESLVSVLAVFTCYNDNCTCIGNIHTKGSRNRLQTIIQSHPNLLKSMDIVESMKAKYDKIKR